MEGVVINNDQMNLAKLFSSQVNTLPRFHGNKGESFRAFETTFRLKYDNSAISSFPVPFQKRALLGCLEGQAARAHTLLGEGTPGWKAAATMDVFLVTVRNLFQPPEESQLAWLVFERTSTTNNDILCQ